MANDKTSSASPYRLVLDNKHRLYTDNIAEWDFYRDLHDGGLYLATKFNHGEPYLWRHMVESLQAYTDRVKRAVDYRNYCEMIVSIFNSNIWSNAPDRTLPKQLEDMGDSVDGRGTDVNDFFKRVTADAMIEGACHVAVDLPRAPTNEKGEAVVIQTEAQRLAYNIKPYFIPYRPQSVIDWEVEAKDPARLGRLNWVVIREEVEQVATAPFAPRTIAVQFRVWTRTAWEIWRYGTDAKGSPTSTKAEMVDSGVHRFGEVPMVTFYNARKHDMIGVSALKDVAPLALKILNKTSVMDDSEYWCCIPLLVFNSNAKAGDIAVGNNRAIVLKVGESCQYVYTPPDAIAAVRETIESLKGDLLQIALRQVHSQRDTAQVQSAEKTYLDRIESTSSMEEKASSFEEAEEALWKLAAQAVGASNEKIEVKYSRKFDKLGVAEDLASQIQLSQLEIPSKTFKAENFKRLTRNILDDAKPEVLAAIDKEIEEWQNKEEPDLAQQNMDLMRKMKEGQNGVQDNRSGFVGKQGRQQAGGQPAAAASDTKDVGRPGAGGGPGAKS